MSETYLSKQFICSRCNSKKIRVEWVVHHKPCAYVGPIYDFKDNEISYTCPKCLRTFDINDEDICDIAGKVNLCEDCGNEEIV